MCSCLVGPGGEGACLRRFIIFSKIRSLDLVVKQESGLKPCPCFQLSRQYFLSLSVQPSAE